MQQFSGPRAKLRAVRRHGNAFREELKRYIASNADTLKVEQPAIAMEYVIYADLNPVPEDMSIIVGDIAHQLRSALDVLACDLATLSGATNTDGVYFPIAKTREGFEDKRSQAKIAKLKPEYRAIIEDIAPYGNSILVGLNALANLDKHRSLIGAVPSINQSEFAALLPPGVSRTGFHVRRPSPLETGKVELIRLPYSSPMGGLHVKLHCNVAFTVEPLIGEPVSETLTEMARTVEGIVDRFEVACFGKSNR